MDLSIRNILIALFFITLLLRSATALTLQHAGYFDAFYYYHVAVNMFEGQGMTESIIWNYLDDPQTLPRPGNQYWMPLTNILAWLGMVLTGGVIGLWRGAQLPFILLGSLLPPLAAWISWQAWQRRDWAIYTGGLTLFSGFYFAYWVVTDNFTPFSLSVALALLAMWKGSRSRRDGWGWWAMAGVAIALSHLARVDGVLLVPLLALWLGWQSLRGEQRDIARFLRHGTAAALGYLLLMAPWLVRNWIVAGTPLPGSGIQTLWLTNYDEIFSYDTQLTLERYLAWGWWQIVRSKLRSFLWTTLVILGSTQFFLAPFILLMMRDAARRPLFQPFLLYTLTLLTAMPLIFTFPAIHGSLVHSTAALLPWMMVLAPPGIERVVRWVAARRKSWQPEQATRVLGAGGVVVAIIVTLFIYGQAVWLAPAPYSKVPPWNDRTQVYHEVDRWLASAGVERSARIFVRNPPGYYVTTGRPALVIPVEGAEVLARAAQKWDSYWLLLDRDMASYYPEMYEERAAVAGWRPVASFKDFFGRPVYLFKFDPVSTGEK